MHTIGLWRAGIAMPFAMHGACGEAALEPEPCLGNRSRVHVGQVGVRCSV
jgi:hypothetical protein